MPFDLGDYVDVAERIAEFRVKHPKGSLQSEVLRWPDDGFPFVAVQATAFRSPTDLTPGKGLAWENFPGRTPYTKDSELQNAETSAWGRAIVAVLAADTKRGVASRQEVSRASGGSSSGESITPPASSSQRQQGTPPGDNVGEGTARSSLNAGGGEPRPGDAVRGNPAAPSPTTTSGTGAGEAGDGSEPLRGRADAPVPANNTSTFENIRVGPGTPGMVSTNELATDEDWATATSDGLTASKAKAIAKGLGITVANATDLTRAEFAVVINKYLEMQAAKK